IHLEAAPVRTAGVAPAPLVPVDAEPVPQLRRVLRVPPGAMRTVTPAVHELAESRRRTRGEGTRDVPGRPAGDHRQPVPGVRAEMPDVPTPHRNRPCAQE